jgi:hypothetical protein
MLRSWAGVVRWKRRGLAEGICSSDAGVFFPSTRIARRLVFSGENTRVHI